MSAAPPTQRRLETDRVRPPSGYYLSMPCPGSVGCGDGFDISFSLLIGRTRESLRIRRGSPKRAACRPSGDPPLRGCPQGPVHSTERGCLATSVFAVLSFQQCERTPNLLPFWAWRPSWMIRVKVTRTKEAALDCLVLTRPTFSVLRLTETRTEGIATHGFQRRVPSFPLFPASSVLCNDESSRPLASSLQYYRERRANAVGLRRGQTR